MAAALGARHVVAGPVPTDAVVPTAPAPWLDPAVQDLKVSSLIVDMVSCACVPHRSCAHSTHQQVSRLVQGFICELRDPALYTRGDAGEPSPHRAPLVTHQICSHSSRFNHTCDFQAVGPAQSVWIFYNASRLQFHDGSVASETLSQQQTVAQIEFQANFKRYTTTKSLTPGTVQMRGRLRDVS